MLDMRRPTEASFLDRDGVINRRIVCGYVMSWDQFEFLPGALDALHNLSDFGRPIFVITNQSCIGRGLVTAIEIERIHACMCDEIKRHGGTIDGVYVCPHRPDKDCSCRKPRPGLLLRAAREHDVDLERSWMVGDSASDVRAGQSAGCRTILVGADAHVNHRTEADLSETRPTLVAESLAGAVATLRNEHG